MKLVFNLFLILFSFIFNPFLTPIYAQETTDRSYYYQIINTQYKINQDSTVDVEEKQTYDFKGAYHQGYRSIPITGADSYYDISVFDNDLSKELVYSPKKLKKEDSSSWGKYTYYSEDGHQIIEWYYNLKDTTHIWTIRYKILGAIQFNKTSDRFYWNVFTNYLVPVDAAVVNIKLPETVNISDVQAYSYRTYQQIKIEQEILSDHSVFFRSGSFAPNEAFTVDVTLPKGIISQASYWKAFTKMNYGWIISGLIIFLTLIAIPIIWLIREGLPKGRGVVVPQFEPPKDLRPALAEVIVKEQLTPKGFSATIIDLAVRGFIKIEEQKKSFIFNLFSTTNYVLTLNKNAKQSKELLSYERDYLDLLFEEKDTFSTEDLSKSPVAEKRAFYEKTQKIKDEIYKQTQSSTKAYAVDPMAEKYKWLFLGGAFLLAIFGFIIQLQFDFFPNQLEILVVTTIFCFIAIWSFVKFEARLNKEGRILKEDWLGFKLYLEVVEKYRLQNLTPSLFEKYLPYAMIFGVEKKWAKAFDKMQLQPPTWYAGGYYTHGAFSSSGSNFSPSGFSASFSSSFASTFASSGAGGGGGGGGGGAGGGGGGGGGGAS